MLWQMRPTLLMLQWYTSACVKERVPQLAFDQAITFLQEDFTQNMTTQLLSSCPMTTKPHRKFHCPLNIPEAFQHSLITGEEFRNLFNLRSPLYPRIEDFTVKLLKQYFLDDKTFSISIDMNK